MVDVARLQIEADSRQVKTASGDLDRLSRSSRDAAGHVDKFGGSVDKTSRTLTFFKSIIGTLAITEMVRQVVSANIEMQRFNNALQVATGSAEGAAREMAFVRKESERLGLNLQTTADQYSRLAAAAKGTALQGQATRDIFTSVAQAATVLGLSSEQTGGALTALEQIISKGKVSAEELRGQLGERLPGAFQIAARSIGVTTAELDKMLSTGSLTAEQLLPALARELDKTFGPQAQQAAQGLNAQINRFNTAMFDLKLAIGELGLIELFNAGIQVVTSLIRLVSTRLLPLLRQVGEFINSIEAVSNVIKAAFGGGVLGALKNVNKETQEINSGFASIPGTIRTASTPASRLLQKLREDANAAAGKGGSSGGVKGLNDELERQRREAERTADEINRLTREYDPLFKRNEELARLIELRAQGLPESIFNAAAAKAINDYIDATNKVEESIEESESAHEKLGFTARNVFDDTSQYAIQAARNIQTSLANALSRSIGDFKDFGRSILDIFTNTFANIASSNILRGLGLGGAVGGAAASGGSGGFLNLLSTGFGITGALGGGLQSLGGAIGSNSLFQFGAGFGGDLLAAGGAGSVAGGLGASLGSIAGPAAIAFAGTQILKSLAGDKRLGGGFGKALNTIGDIPIIGDFLPIVPLINGLFGRGAPKFQNEALVGNVSAGGFEGVLNQAFREKGGLARSDRVSNFITDTDSGALLNQFGRLSESGNIPSALKGAADPAIKKALEVGQLLDDTFISLGKTMENTAEILGISSDGLKNFSAELDLVSEKGETLSEAQISEAIADISNQMVESLIPSIDELSRSGETATDTLVRIGAEFQALENALIVSGAGIQEARDQIQALSLEQRTAIADQFGGAAELQAQVQNFFSNVLSDSQQLEIVRKRALDVANSLGINFIPTLDQLAEAFKKGTLETKALIFQHDDLVKQYQDLNRVLDYTVTKTIDAANSLEGITTAIGGMGAESEKTSEQLDRQYKEDRLRARDRNLFTAGRRDIQLGITQAPTVATTIQGKIFTEDEIRAMQQAAVDSATTALQNIVKEQLSRLGESYREAQSFIKDQIDAVKESNRFFAGLKDDFLEVSTSSRAAAHEQLNAAIELAKSGADISLIDTPELANAIKTLKEDRTDLFSTREAFEMDRAKAANSILELSRLGVARSDDTLNTLKEQLDVMKSSFEVQEQLLNAQLRFSGVNDASLLSDQELNSGGAFNSLIEQLAIQAGTSFNGSVRFPDPRPGNDLDALKNRFTSQFNSLVQSTGTSFDFADMAQALKEMKQELAKIKTSSEKTASVLSTVTRDGRAMQTA